MGIFWGEMKKLDIELAAFKKNELLKKQFRILCTTKHTQSADLKGIYSRSRAHFDFLHDG